MVFSHEDHSPPEGTVLHHSALFTGEQSSPAPPINRSCSITAAPYVSLHNLLSSHTLNLFKMVKGWIWITAGAEANRFRETRSFA